ncbi:hypothetical protein C8J57DRAFT_1263000 [Mycena rebaudengoi]|nr:hypothetical protein C8J57DRAFT_1263000 [Mycena rebaudengoi]
MSEVDILSDHLAKFSSLQLSLPTRLAPSAGTRYSLCPSSDCCQQPSLSFTLPPLVLIPSSCRRLPPAADPRHRYHRGFTTDNNGKALSEKECEGERPTRFDHLMNAVAVAGDEGDKWRRSQFGSSRVKSGEGRGSNVVQRRVAGTGPVTKRGRLRHRTPRPD